MPNIEYFYPKRTPIFRKVAIGTWATTYDPQVYGTMTVRMERALEFIEKFRKETGKRLTVTHLVAKAVAIAFKKMPDANAVLRFSRIYPRKTIDIFLQVLITDDATGKPDLSGVTLRGVDNLSLEDVVDHVAAKVEKVRKRQDQELEKSRGFMARLPGFVVGPLLRLVGFLMYGLNLDLRRFGFPKDPFGSVMITNIGSLGLEQAFAPLVPYCRVPMILAVGQVTDEAVVDGDRIIPGKLLRLSATFDHRIIDGAHAAVLANSFREVFSDPENALAEK